LLQSASAAQLEQQRTLSTALYGDANRRDEPDSVFGLLKKLATEMVEVRRAAEEANRLWAQELYRRKIWRQTWGKIIALLLPNWKPLLLWGGGLTFLFAAFAKLFGG
jgi:hypothetical protein